MSRMFGRGRFVMVRIVEPEGGAYVFPAHELLGPEEGEERPEVDDEGIQSGQKHREPGSRGIGSKLLQDGLDGDGCGAVKRNHRLNLDQFCLLSLCAESPYPLKAEVLGRPGVGAVSEEKQDLCQQDNAVECVGHIQSHHLGNDYAGGNEADGEKEEEIMPQTALDAGFQAMQVNAGRRDEQGRQGSQDDAADSRARINIAQDDIGKTHPQDHEEHGHKGRECLNP